MALCCKHDQEQAATDTGPAVHHAPQPARDAPCAQAPIPLRGVAFREDRALRPLRTGIASTTQARIAGCLLALAAAAAAGQPEPLGTVMERSRPRLDPAGIRVGGFDLLPTLGFEVRRNDNIFAGSDTRIGDTILSVQPGFDMRSDWSRNRLRFFGDAAINRFSDNSAEDFENWRLGAAGELALGDGRLDGEVSHADLREDRTSPDDRQGLERNRFTRDIFAGRYRHRAGRLLLTGDARFETLDFDPTPAAGGGFIPNDDRDRDEVRLGMRGAIEMSPDYALFVEAATTRISFDQEVDRFGFQRSSEGYDLIGGVEFDLSAKTFGEFYVGYLEAEFDDPRFQDAGGAVFGADLTWNVTGLTTITVNGSRTLERTTIPGASGIFTTRLGARIDHELRRQLLLSLDLASRVEDFDGLPREDDIEIYSLGARYLANRNFFVDVGLRREDRNTTPSDSGGRVFRINELFVRVVGRL